MWLHALREIFARIPAFERIFLSEDQIVHWHGLHVPDTLVLSVVLYIVLRVGAAQLIRRRVLDAGGDAALGRVLGFLQPLSLVSLLATLVLLFGFQGEQILRQPLVIALLAVPILIQVYFNSGFAYLLNRLVGEQHCVAGPSALIGASNFFELAVAAAISLFGFIRVPLSQPLSACSLKFRSCCRWLQS